MKNNEKARVIAFYLPQYHPIPENDAWWGKGFTEWTNVGKARPLFKGHYQPRVPADLGYYDLRIPEIRKAQAEMAKYAGIEGFAYWHYWFAGKRLLERPINEILKSGKPDLPFCFAWANETWSGIWHGKPGTILIEQSYPGKEDYVNHFYACLEAFTDQRYICVDDKLLFILYKPLNLPNPNEFIEIWNTLAIQNGLNGFYFVGVTLKNEIETIKILNVGFDAVNINQLAYAKHKVSNFKNIYSLLSQRYFKSNIGLSLWNYEDIIRNWISEDDFKENVFQSILPNWDNSPRSGRRGVILKNSTPQLFEQHLLDVLNTVNDKKHKIVFLKSWNEWAEGNYVEPDMKYGKLYLDILHKHLNNP